MSNDRALILRTKVEKIEKELEKSAPKILKALPPQLGMTPEQFNRAAFTAITGNNKVIECVPGTIVRSVIESAELGLTLQKSLGQAFIVPYRVKGVYVAQLQVGYRGYVSLFYRSGIIDQVFADVVIEGEEFEYFVGAHGPQISHKPPLDRATPTRQNVVASYAMVRVRGSEYPVVRVTSKQQIEEARAHNQAIKKGFDSPAWEEHYDEMAMKTAILRVRKFLPADAMKWTSRAEEIDADLIDLGDLPATPDAPHSDELEGALASEEVREAEVVDAE
jgi:recombination protein RecT